MLRLVTLSATGRLSLLVTRQGIRPACFNFAVPAKVVISDSTNSLPYSTWNVDNTVKKFGAGSTSPNITKPKVPKTIQRLVTNARSLPYESFQKVRASLLEPGAITNDNVCVILGSCSRLVDRSADERALLVNAVWKRLVQLIGKPTKSQFLSLIDAFGRTGMKLGDYQNFLKKYQIELDADVYERLVCWACESENNLEKVNRILDDMKNDGFQLTENIQNALISTYSLEQLDEYSAKIDFGDVKPTAESYKALIIRYLHHNETKRANDMFSRTVFNTDQLYAIIRAAVPYQYEQLIIAAIDALPETIRSAKLLPEAIQNICTEIVYLNCRREPDARVDPYELLVQHFPVPSAGESGDIDDYGCFLLREMIATEHSVDEILKFCENLRQSQRNPRALHFACVSAMSHGRTIAKDLLCELSKIEPLRPHYLWPLFIRADEFSETEKILQLAADTKTMLDMRTLYEYVLPRMTALDSQKIVAILSDYGVQMNDLKSALIAFLLSQNHVEEAKTIAHLSKAYITPTFILPQLDSFVRHKGFKKSGYALAELVKTLQKSKSTEVHYDLAGQLLYSVSDTFVKAVAYNYVKAGVRISSNMADLIISKLHKDRNLCDEMSPILSGMIDAEMFVETHEKQKFVQIGTRVQQLEHQLSSLEVNELPTHGALFKLFGMYVQKRDMTRAREVYEKCEKANVIATAAFVAMCIQYWTLKENANNALREYERLRNTYQTFKLDEYKVVDLMTLLIDKDRLNEAYDVLDKAPRGAKRLDRISKNIWCLLNAASNHAHRHQQSDNLAEQMLEALVQKGYCQHSNKHLSVIIKEYLDKNDIHRAVEKFEAFAKAHKSLPYLLTFLTTLIRAANEEATADACLEKFQIDKEQALDYIQRIIDIALTQRSPASVNANILMAFACAGNESQVRKILLNPDIDLNAEQLTKAVEYLATRGQVDGVLVLARAARGTQYASLSQSTIQEALIAHYEMKNDYEGAIKLYDILSADNEVSVSRSFAVRLKVLLKRNQQQIPQELAHKI